MPWTPTPVAAPVQPQFAPPEENVSGFRDFFTGENRTEFPDAPEFLQAYAGAGMGRTEGQGDLTSLMRSKITSNPQGQLDILRKNIPGLEARPDKFGNIMVRAPGMKEFAYLNKPGASSADLDEIGTQTLATLPFLGVAGKGTTALGRAAYGASGLAGASVAEDALASAAGSEQGISPAKAAVSGTLGGLTAGIAEPVIGRTLQAAGKALSYPVSRVRSALNPDAEATRRVMGAARDDMRSGKMAMNATQTSAARARGQDPRVMDVAGETVRAEARRAANVSPAAREELTDFIQNRFQSQGMRLEDFVSKLVRRSGSSRAPNAFLSREQLESAARASRNPLYKAAYQRGAGGVMTDRLRQLMTAPDLQRAFKASEREIKNRVAAGRSKGAYANNRPTLETWDLVKRRLDDRIRSLKRSGSNSQALDLDSLRVQLLRELDRLIPEYAQARGTAATFFGATDALEAGQKFVRGRYDLDQARQAINKMTAQERDLFAEGFASRFIDDISRVSDHRNILNTINSSRDARERMTTALGPNRYREVESFLRVEKFMDFARQALGNSTTARQLMEAGFTGYGLYTGDPNALMVGLLSLGSRHMGRAIDRRVAEKVVQQLLSKDVNTFLKGVKQVASSPLLDALRAFDDVVARLGLARTIGAREAGQELSAPPTPTASNPSPPVSLPPSRGTPGAPPPPSPTTPPQGDGAPGTSGNQVNATDPSEVYRMAAEAIAAGAPIDAVKARLASYGYDPEAIS